MMWKLSVKQHNWLEKATKGKPILSAEKNRTSLMECITRPGQDPSY